MIFQVTFDSTTWLFYEVMWNSNFHVLQEYCTRTHILDMFLAESRVPTWQSLFDQVLEEEGGIAVSGVCSSLRAALRLKELYEDETVTQYRAKSTVTTFGRTDFKRTTLRRATFRLMGVRLYTPIFILAKNRYVCHQGPDIDKGLKERRKRAKSGVKGSRSKRRKICVGSDFSSVSERPRHCQLSKKVGCPATLTMYEVLIANCEDADFDDELSWRARIATKEIELQRFIVVFLPRYHEGHEIGRSSASCVSRSWHPDVRAKLTSLLMDGIREPDEMTNLLKHYVETDLCATYTTKPNADDRRYYPLRTDIRNAIAYDLKEKKVLTKPDDDRLMELFQQWAEIDPDGQVFYRPRMYSEVEGKQNLLLVYQSSNQHYLMQRYGTELLFVDESTAYGIPVFFVSVKTNFVCHVVAFFVTAVSSMESIAEGLATVKSWNIDLEPRFVMCEPDVRHFDAVQAVWPDAHLLLCDVCREQDWAQWIDNKKNGLANKPHCKQEILARLRQIARANSRDEFDIAHHRLLCSKVYEDSLPLQLYFGGKYMSVMEKWVQYYRHDLHTKIDTSNANERRGGLMLKHYKQSVTANFSTDIITLLSSIKQTLETMWQDYCKANMKQVTLESDYEFEDALSHLANRPCGFVTLQLKACEKAKHFFQQRSDASSYFTRMEDNTDVFLVKDFTDTDRWYRLELNSSSGDASCSCSTFHKHKMPCEHFYAVFTVFDDVSWFTLPAAYRDHAFFTFDPRCFQFAEDDSHSPETTARDSDSQSVRSINISRLTGLLDKIKASAGSVNDQSLSSCVEQVEAAAILMQNAAPAVKCLADGENLLPSSVTMFERQSSQPGHSADEVERSMTKQNPCAIVPEKNRVSHKNFSSKIHELTLNSQRLQQQQCAVSTMQNNRTEENESMPGDVWIQQGDILLTQQHRAMILEGDELDDTIVAASLALLRIKDQDGHYSGLLAPSQLSAVQFEGRHDENLIQVMKVVNNEGARWICVSTVGCQPSAVDVYDCAFPSELSGVDIYSHAIKMQIAALLTLPLDQQSFTMHAKPVAQREGPIASGLFAIAFATDLIYHQHIVGTLDQKSLASHLELCLSSGCLLPFPKLDDNARGHLSLPFSVEIPIYCMCRLPDSETRESDDEMMVMCSADKCQIQWYHLHCVGATPLERERARRSSWYCDWCK